jgi:hypothetical protein
VSKLSKEREALIHNVAVTTVILARDDGDIEVVTKDYVITTLDKLQDILRRTLRSYHINVAGVAEEDAAVTANAFATFAGELVGLTPTEIQNRKEGA